MFKVYSIVLYLIIAYNSTSAQWNVGASYKFKSAVPNKGVGINVSRNLPVQFADWGVKIRAEIDLFRSSEFDAQDITKKYLTEDYHLEVISTFFTRNISPYLGFSVGYSHLNISDLNKGGIIFSILTGVRLLINKFFYPYIEVQGLNYFIDLNETLTKKEISSFQIRGVVGLSFILNSIE